MRYLCALAVLGSFGLAHGASAQDVFGSVTVEPRPEEYIHWDAEAGRGPGDDVHAHQRDGVTRSEATWLSR